MKHVKYRSIIGSWVKKEVEYLKLKGFSHPSIKWCVTEKIHGSNFAFYMDLDELKTAKRNSFIKDGENFFQYLRMKESNGYKIRDLWNQLVKEGYELETLTVYGELFGGFYPHPDVERLPNIQKIQKGVWYNNDIGFYCFDILVNGKFLPMTEVCRLCEEVNIFYARILFTGTFEECMEHSDQFQTKIPEWLGLPLMDPDERHVVVRQVFKGVEEVIVGTNEDGSIEYDEVIIYEDKEIVYFGNICEGIVIKPVEDLRYEDGDRVILKSKNQVFMEVSKEKKSVRKKHHDFSEYAIETLEKLVVYVNENRLRNVLSKIGTFTKRDFKKIFDEFKKDIYEDFNVNHNNLRDMEKLDKREIDKVVGKLCTDIWRPIFLTEAERK